MKKPKNEAQSDMTQAYLAADEFGQPPPMLTPSSRKMVEDVDPDELHIVTDPEHVLYQARALQQPPEWMVESVLERGVFTRILWRKGPVVAGKQRRDVLVGRMRTKSARLANVARRAAGKMGMTIPCEEFRGSDAEALAIMAAENAQRVEVDPMTRAETAAQALRFGATEAKVMNANVWTRAQFESHMALLNVAPRVQAAVQDGRIQLAAVRAIAKLDRPAQDAAVDRLVAKGKTGPREVENAIDAENPGAVLAKAEKPRPLRKRAEIEAKLAELEWAHAEIGNTELDDGITRGMSARHADRIAGLRFALGENTL